MDCQGYQGVSYAVKGGSRKQSLDLDGFGHLQRQIMAQVGVLIAATVCIGQL